jgi:hypothetical protein
MALQRAAGITIHRWHVLRKPGVYLIELNGALRLSVYMQGKDIGT